MHEFYRSNTIVGVPKKDIFSIIFPTGHSPELVRPVLHPLYPNYTHMHKHNPAPPHHFCHFALSSSSSLSSSESFAPHYILYKLLCVFVYMYMGRTHAVAVWVVIIIFTARFLFPIVCDRCAATRPERPKHLWYIAYSTHARADEAVSLCFLHAFFIRFVAKTQ